MIKIPTLEKNLDSIKTIKLPLKVVIVVDSEIGDVLRAFPFANDVLMLEIDVIAVADDTIFEAFIVVDTIFVDVSDNVEDEVFIAVTVVVLIFEICVDADSVVFLLTESYQISDIHQDLTRMPVIETNIGLIVNN